MSEKSKEGFIKSNLPWFLFISISISLGLASYIIYYQRESQIKLGDLISISSGLISIALAVVAIIYSVSESIKNNVKEQELSNIVSKVDGGVSDTQDILDKVNKQIIDLQDSVEVIKGYFQQGYDMKKVEESIRLMTNDDLNTDNLSVNIKNTEYNNDVDSAITNLEGVNSDSDYDEFNKDNNIEKLDGNHNKVANDDVENKSEVRQKNIVCRRGEVFYADTSPARGSEIGGIRPVVIIQNDIGNRYSPTVIVAAITSQISKAKLPIHVEVSAEEYGLNRDSVVLLEQIRTLDKRRLKEKIGCMSETDMMKIDKAAQISLKL